jgi:hypothetical protein
MEDYYTLTNSNVERMKGLPLLRAYENSVFKALKSIFPEYDWQPWRFPQVTKLFFDDQRYRDQVIYVKK